MSDRLQIKNQQKESDGGIEGDFVSYNQNDNKNITEKNQARSNIGVTSMTPQFVFTNGDINNLETTSNYIVFTGSNVVLSGIASRPNGEEVCLQNRTSSQMQVLTQSTNSLTMNRIRSGVAVSVIILPPFSFLMLKYDSTLSRWCVFDSYTLRESFTNTLSLVDTGSGGATYTCNSSLVFKRNFLTGIYSMDLSLTSIVSSGTPSLLGFFQIEGFPFNQTMSSNSINYVQSFIGSELTDEQLQKIRFTLISNGIQFRLIDNASALKPVLFSGTSSIRLRAITV